MRFISNLQNEQQARTFSTFLKEHGVEHQLDVTVSNDWGTDDHGRTTINLWVVSEDQVVQVQEWLKEFEQDPSSPLFLPKVDALTSTRQAPKAAMMREADLRKMRLSVTPQQKGEKGVITYMILALCTVIFIFGEAMQPPIPYSQINKIYYGPLSIPPVNKPLMYDYPGAFEIIDKVVALYGIQALEDPNTMPLPGKFLLQQYSQTPYWQGVYDQIIIQLKQTNSVWNFSAPMFEKIREGQVWRLFTPIFLHYDLLHIFFNMAWLLLLGKQIESRIHGGRYIAFILITAVLSNTAQYLMSGSNFIGFSGVVCAMIAFIWTRQRNAAWEGYQLQQSTLIFVGVFIVSIVVLQFISFLAELSGMASFTPGIANTAHLVGAFSGYLIGRIPAFAWRR